MCGITLLNNSERVVGFIFIRTSYSSDLAFLVLFSHVFFFFLGCSSLSNNLNSMSLGFFKVVFSKAATYSYTSESFTHHFHHNTFPTDFVEQLRRTARVLSNIVLLCVRKHS